MNANIKMQAGAIVAAAVLIAAAGGWMLSRMMRDMEANQAAFEDMRSERWKALMRDLQSELKHTSPAKRESVFRKRLDEEPYAQGGFIWAKGKGLTFSINMPPDLASEFPTNYQWEVDGKTVHLRRVEYNKDAPLAYVRSLPAVTMKADKLAVSTGQNWRDAVCGAALCGKNRSIMLLADAKTSKSNYTRATSWCNANKVAINKAYVLGGTSAVQAKVWNALLMSTG